MRRRATRLRLKGAVKRKVFGHRLAIEFRELAQRVSVGDPFPQFAIIPVLDALQYEGAQNLRGVNPLRPVAGFFRPRSRSRRTASIISSWSSRKSEMVCRSGSREMPCCSNSQSAKLIWDFAVLATLQFSFFFDAWSLSRFKALT
jgi:hypothetical protein